MFYALKRKNLLFALPVLRHRRMNPVNLNRITELFPKKGSPHLSAALFQVMDCLLKTQPVNDPVFQFIDRKRSEGKHYYSYMCAGSAKFLRIYYARVKEYLTVLD